MTQETEFKELVELIAITDGELEEMLSYLDALRETGVTNMFGAAPYLEAEFPGLSKRDARRVLGHWMKTFSERHQRE